MNESVEQIQDWYRNERELSNYSIMDIGENLETLAKKGLIWVLKDLKDTCEIEEIAIEYYLNKNRENQIYDSLENNVDSHTSHEKSTSILFQNLQENVSIEKPKKNTLKVRDISQFKGYLMAKDLEGKIIEMCKSYPPFERNHIVDQIGRSAGSIKKRIAMGEQCYIGEKFNQYSIAIGSAKETSLWLHISLGQKYISQELFNNLDKKVTKIVAILTGTLANIKKREGKGMDLPSPYTPNVKNFDAYNQVLQLVERVYEMTEKKGFWGERYLQNEIRKNTTSCAANIAEAHQLHILKTFSYFNKALEMLNGIDSLLDTSVSKQIITEESLADIRKLRESIRNILTKRLANISKEKAS